MAAAKKLKVTQIIHRCLESILLLVSDQTTMEDYSPDAEDKIEQLMDYLNDVQRIDFEDMLLDIAANIVKHTREFGEVAQKANHAMRNVFNKNEKRIAVVFELFKNFASSSSN